MQTDFLQRGFYGVLFWGFFVGFFWLVVFYLFVVFGGVVAFGVFSSFFSEA